jgi:hypothetical protein
VLRGPLRDDALKIVMGGSLPRGAACRRRYFIAAAGAIAGIALTWRLRLGWKLCIRANEVIE